MKAPLQLVGLISLGLIGCGVEGGRGQAPGSGDGAITRNNIDAILNDPKRKSLPEGRRILDLKEIRDRETLKAFAVEREADVVVEYDGEMMIVDRSGGGSLARRSSAWIAFFDSQARKKLVVVIFHKNVWSDHRLQSEIAGINRYFFARGYERVVIQQARGISRPTWSDVKANGEGKP